MAQQGREKRNTRPVRPEGDTPEPGELKPVYGRGRWRRYLWVVWLLLMIPVVYFAIQVFIILMPRTRTEQALQDVMVDSMELPGYVSLQSQPVTAGGGGVLYYTVPAGQRVSAGTPVAEIYATEEAASARASLEQVREEISMLETAQRTLTDSGDAELYSKQVQNSVYDLLDTIGMGDYSKLDAPKADLTLAANKLQIVTDQPVSFDARLAALDARRAELEALAVPIDSIAAPETGYFVPTTKYDRVVPGYDALAEITPAGLETSLSAGTGFYGSDVIGHIVKDYRWYFFAVVEGRDIEKFNPGDKSLQITFPEVSDASLPVSVQAVTVDEATGLAKVQLYCEYINPSVLQMRAEKAEIIFRTEKGIRISTEALRIVDGVKGVYVRFGNTANFRPIDILIQDEYYMLVSGTYQRGVNEVELYDIIITDSGGMELYDGKYL